MNFEGITDVFFDLDHTLWDFDKNSKLAFARVFQKHEISINLEDFITKYEPINFDYWKYFRENRVTKEELRRGRLIDTFSSFNVQYSLKQIDAFAESYIEELPLDNYLFEGTIEILQYLSSKYKLHIITNGFQEVQHLKLRNSDIFHYFSTITSSEETGVKKPDPLIFTIALKKANATAATSVMIGDTFEADILGAEGLGIKTIFFNYRKEKSKEGYTVIHFLHEIKNSL